MLCSVSCCDVFWDVERGADYNKRALVLPIYGEVSAQPTEGLTGPPHLWGGVGAADGGACSSGLLPTVESARRGLRRRSSCPRSAAPPRRPRRVGATPVPPRAAPPRG